ncbi:MAG: PepSY domain-containing protein [Rhodobacteraceae bacterium]|nr:PepSY domain-containing protein [Paracoccaceae bacterium]
MSVNASKKLSRREALLRLGLGAAAIYAAPAVSTMSQAHASEGGSGGGGSGGGGSGGSGGDSGEPSSSGQTEASSSPSSGADTEKPQSATMPARDYRRAQNAVSEGRALPLSEIMEEVHEQLDVSLISVKYQEAGSTNHYLLRLLSSDGTLVNLQVDALTAEIVKMGGS